MVPFPAHTAFWLLLLGVAGCGRVFQPSEIVLGEGAEVTAVVWGDSDADGLPDLVMAVSSPLRGEGLVGEDSVTFVHVFERRGRGESFGHVWTSPPLGRSGPEGRLRGMCLDRGAVRGRKILFSGPDADVHVSFEAGRYGIAAAGERIEGTETDGDIDRYLGFQPEASAWWRSGEGKDRLVTLRKGLVELWSEDGRGRLRRRKRFRVAGAEKVFLGGEGKGVEILVAVKGGLRIYPVRGP